MDSIAEPESLSVCLHVSLHDIGGDVFPGSNPEDGLVHGKVAELVRSQHVIGFETLIQAMLGPDSSDRAGRFQQEDMTAGVDFTVGLDGGKSAPAWSGCRVSSGQFLFLS